MSDDDAAVDLLLAVPVPALVRKNPPLIPDIGLGYLAASARRQGFSTHVMDWVPRIGIKEYRRQLVVSAPKVVGIKAFTVNIQAVTATLRIVRDALPETIIVIGGPHPSTSEPEWLFEDFPDIDFAFRGECESSLCIFLEIARDHGFSRRAMASDCNTLGSVAGLVWRDNGTTIANTPTLEDIDSIPLPAWDLIDPRHSLHNPVCALRNGENPWVAPLTATRGCPYTCTFCCAHMINGKKSRRRRPGDVVNEIAFLKGKHETTQFLFTDSAFMLDLNWVSGFCAALIESGLDVRWECIYEVQNNLTKSEADSIFRIMHDAGCRRMGFSPETASPRMIEKVHKHYNPDALRVVIASAKEIGMSLIGFFLVGFPGETLRDIHQTVDFALQNPFDVRFISLALPLPGTEIYSQFKLALDIRKMDWSKFDFQYPSPTAALMPPEVLFKEHAYAMFRAQSVRRADHPASAGLMRFAWLARGLFWSCSHSLPWLPRVIGMTNIRP